VLYARLRQEIGGGGISNTGRTERQNVLVEAGTALRRNNLWANSVYQPHPPAVQCGASADFNESKGKKPERHRAKVAVFESGTLTRSPSAHKDNQEKDRLKFAKTKRKTFFDSTKKHGGEKKKGEEMEKKGERGCREQRKESEGNTSHKQLELQRSATCREHSSQRSIRWRLQEA